MPVYFDKSLPNEVDFNMNYIRSYLVSLEIDDYSIDSLLKIVDHDISGDGHLKDV